MSAAGGGDWHCLSQRLFFVAQEAGECKAFEHAADLSSIEKGN